MPLPHYRIVCEACETVISECKCDVPKVTKLQICRECEGA